ncbi:putative oxidoreductase [Chryseolinea serpens]|uniref:Putative oxidoreductase n=1 Tax=Chryseolinea serpens TaxID=947013 RepID=A0A1M5VNW8_9BACT|nr:DoxX family protein [Chryseolinea serpens]SHH76927.1 putative oxidoreductase [Chryseolinea serpens]
MTQKIFATDSDLTGFVTRLTIGLVMFPHGMQKVFGWFGGPGYANEMRFFTETLHIPWLVAFAVIVIEFLGSISLIIGFASRLWAGAMIFLFIGIIFTEHVDHGFFMNWYGTQKGEGYEYHLLIIGLSLATLIRGSGKYSMDRILVTNK